jgi:hypothetical protein
VLLPLFLTFDNRNVAVDRKILEALSFTAQQRPVYLKTIDLLAPFGESLRQDKSGLLQRNSRMMGA